MLPFDHIPQVILIHLAKNAVFWLNMLPHPDGMSSTHSSHYIMTGQELQYDLHVHLEFREHVETHEAFTNEMYERTLGAIYLGPNGNAQGGHWLMSLATGA